MKQIFPRAGLRATGRGGFRRARRGSEVLELALLILPLSLLIYGGIEFGYFFFIQHNVQAAAREGARAYVPLNAESGEAIAKAELYLTNAKLNPGDFSITAGPDGDNVVVTVEAPWSNFSGRMLRLIPASKKVSGTAVMRKEEIPEP